MSAAILLLKNCLQISSGVSLLRARFCGPDLCSMTFAASTRPVEFIVAVH